MAQGGAIAYNIGDLIDNSKKDTQTMKYKGREVEGAGKRLSTFFYATIQK